MLKNFISASILSLIYTANTKYDVYTYMYIQVNIDLKIENVTLTKNVSV